jgi:uncharacterized protein (TIGR03083 family)
MLMSWDVAGDLPAIDTRELIHEVREALLELLEELEDESWAAATINPGWDVHDVALHLLGDDVSWLSSRRDHYRAGGVSTEDFGELAALIEAANERWVQATRSISPRLTIDLLRFVGGRFDDHVQVIDLDSEGSPVGWSGRGPSPTWLDIAREYTERWMHQQQIREAVGRPGLTEPRWLHPVLDIFMRALPRALDQAPAWEGVEVTVVVEGPAGGSWSVRRGPDRWRLVAGAAAQPEASVRVPEDIAWRLLCRNIPLRTAMRQIETAGDGSLAAAAYQAVAVMTTQP